MLLEQGTSVTGCDSHGEQPIHLAARVRKQTPPPSQKRKSNNMSDRRFHNDLHILEYFQAGHVHILEMLLSRGADLMARYKNVSFEFAHALKIRDIEESTV